MIRSHTKTTTKGDGEERVRRLLKILKQAPKAHVQVGFFEGTSYPGGPDVVEVALWNELGTRKTPARSFMGTAIDEAEASIAKWRDEIIEGIVEKGWTIEQGMEFMGEKIKGLIEAKIKSNVGPPDAPSTAAQKAHEGAAPDTLIHSGLMLRSLTYKVFLK